MTDNPPRDEEWKRPGDQNWAEWNYGPWWLKTELKPDMMVYLVKSVRLPAGINPMSGERFEASDMFLKEDTPLPCRRDSVQLAVVDREDTSDRDHPERGLHVFVLTANCILERRYTSQGWVKDMKGRIGAGPIAATAGPAGVSVFFHGESDPNQLYEYRKDSQDGEWRVAAVKF